MIANISSSRMTKEVEEIGQMNFSGNVVHSSWFQNIRYKSGKSNVNAVFILSEILYRYCPGQSLKVDYSTYAEKFGFSQRQVAEAFHFLKNLGLINLLPRAHVVSINIEKILDITVLANDVEYSDPEESYKPPTLEDRFKHSRKAVNHTKHTEFVFKRDGCKCVYCGSDRDLTLDHQIPQSRGGSHKPDNLVTCCATCNSKKGARTPEEWRAVLTDSL